MQLGIKNKVFMVAGASQGLGFGIARALAAEGASLSLASRDKNAISNAAESIKSEFGVEAIGVATDVTSKTDITHWHQLTQQSFGSVNGLVVNAGGPKAGQFDDFDDLDWQQAFELTLLSAVRCVRQVLPSLRQAQAGSILVVTSSSVKEPIEALLLSNVMRSGVTSLAKSLATQLAKEGIRVNNLMPGRINTNRVKALDDLAAQKAALSSDNIKASQEHAIPLGRYGDIDEFGKAAAFLLSEAASYITGTTLAIDGGKMRTVW